MRRRIVFSMNPVVALCALFLVVPGAPVVGQEVDACPENQLAGRMYYGEFDRMEFSCSGIAHRDLDPMEAEITQRSYTYRLLEEHRVSFMEVSGDSGGRWLVLKNDRMVFLYDGSENHHFFRAVTGSPNSMEAYYRFSDNFSASSTLTEGNIVYEAENLGSEWLAKPWVEGAPGQGIGEEIRIDQWFSRLWISIGYVSYERPELYEMNSRPSRIRVISEATGDEAVFELEDTPNPQPIEVPGEYETASEGPIRIIIEDVYPGTRWEDTCINFIAFF